jgi:hypothetical protein
MTGWLMNMEQLVEWELTRETEVRGDNLLQCHVIHKKFHMTWPGIEKGLPRYEAGDYQPELGFSKRQFHEAI